MQQAVALVSPRIENQVTQNIQILDNQTPSTSGTHSTMVWIYIHVSIRPSVYIVKFSAPERNVFHFVDFLEKIILFLFYTTFLGRQDKHNKIFFF